MQKQILLVSFVLAVLFLIGCGSQATTPEPTATRAAISNTGNRTVVARPVGTAVPAQNAAPTDTPELNVGITTEAGETAVPTDAANPPPQNTAAAPNANATSVPAADAPTPLPTANIVRPLLPTTVPAGSTAPTPQTQQVGTPIKLGDAAVTVTGIQTSQGGQGDVPRPGDEYLIVALTLENKGSTTFTFDATQFAIKTSDGKVIDYEDVTFQDNVLRTTDLAPNAKQDVTVVFDVPQGATGLTLVLGNADTGGVATVKLN